MHKYRGLFIGLTTIDIQYFVEKFPISNVKIKTNQPDILVGGPATNAAVAFSHLNNGSTFLASATGLNSFNKFIQDDLDFTNVTHFNITANQNISPVIASVVTTLEKGDRNVFTHNPDTILPEFSSEELFQKVVPQIVMLDGFHPEFSLECAQLAKQQNIPVVMDCGSWKPQYEQLLKFTDIVICSEDFYPPNCLNTNQVFDYLQSEKVEKIAISKGEKNIHFLDEINRGEVTVEQIKVADTLGAGDFLHGAFCYYILQTNNFKTSIKKAAELATFSCKYRGTRDWLNFTK